MKPFLILITCALLVAAVDGRAQTNSTAQTKIPMTLDIDPADGSKALRNPTDDDIRKAVASLREENPGFLILKRDDAHAVQVTCVSAGSFAIQAQDGANQIQAAKNVSADAAVTLLLAYRNGGDWKKLAEWKPM
jgi:hypothetical protein